MRWWRPGTTGPSMSRSAPRCRRAPGQHGRRTDGAPGRGDRPGPDDSSYDRLFGQYKNPEGDHGPRSGRPRPVPALAGGTQQDLTTSQRDAARTVFDGWVQVLERLRAKFALDSEDDRAWSGCPCSSPSEPNQHDEQAEIDGVIERLVHQEFTDDNAALYLTGQQFLFELSRMLRQTERYHVLCSLHDYRGVTPQGRPDKVAFAMTRQGYMASLRRHVEAYDRTGVFPVYGLPRS